jgi:hypothetical protein
MPNKQRSTTDPMAEDELTIRDITDYVFNTDMVVGEPYIKLREMIETYTTNKIIEELEKFDAMKPETGAYLSDMIADRIAELRKTL